MLKLFKSYKAIRLVNATNKYMDKNKYRGLSGLIKYI